MPGERPGDRCRDHKGCGETSDDQALIGLFSSFLIRVRDLDVGELIWKVGHLEDTTVASERHRNGIAGIVQHDESAGRFDRRPVRWELRKATPGSSWVQDRCREWEALEVCKPMVLVMVDDLTTDSEFGEQSR